jgi:hypothetical protein
MAVGNPQILQSDRRLDFGTGFYLTSSYEQAERWAYLTVKRRETGEQTITCFDLEEEDMDAFNVLRFYNADKSWLKFVSDNRNDGNFVDRHDIVVGPVADDRTMPVLRLYFAGIYDEEETLKRLLPQKLKDQFAFKTEKSLKILKLREVINYE